MPELRAIQCLVLPGTEETASSSSQRITSVADFFPLHQKQLNAKPAHKANKQPTMAATANKTRNPTSAFSQLSGTFPFGVVVVTASRGAVGSHPDRAGAMIPPWMQGALWHELSHFSHMDNGGRSQRKRCERGFCYSLKGAAGPSASPDSEISCCRNLRSTNLEQQRQADPRVANKMYQKLRSCSRSCGVSQQQGVRGYSIVKNREQWQRSSGAGQQQPGSLRQLGQAPLEEGGGSGSWVFP